LPGPWIQPRVEDATASTLVRTRSPRSRA
jgi:hypothetical protein